MDHGVKKGMAMAGGERLADRARSIFEELGYTVTWEGGELRAERAWKTVSVTTVHDTDDPGRSGNGDLRCFVADDTVAEEVHRRVRRRDPEYDWAVIAVGSEGDYEVLRSTTTASRPRSASD